MNDSTAYLIYGGFALALVMLIYICVLRKRNSELRAMYDTALTQKDFAIDELGKVSRALRRAHGETNSLLKGLSSALDLDHKPDSDDLFTDPVGFVLASYLGGVHTAINKVRSEAGSGNRQELVECLWKIHTQLGMCKITRDEFVEEFIKTPHMLVVRIAAHVSGVKQ